MFDGIKLTELTRKINYLKIPVTKVSLERYNTLVRYFNDLYEKGKITRAFLHTNSNGISMASKNMFNNFNCYEVFQYRWGAELCFVISEGMARVQIEKGQVPDDRRNIMTGRRAFTRFKKELLKDGIDIKKYYINNGKKVKETIEKPLCKMFNNIFINRTFENAYHLDINSAYPSQMVEMFPEWSKTIQRIYDKRKQKEVYKCILNYTYGFFQSMHFGAKLANVSKYCIENTNKKLIDLALKLQKAGCIILSYNVDGIWFICKNEEVINILKESSSGELGMFKLDHSNCKIRFKGPKAYEFIEDGEFNVKYSGYTTLDRIKPRSMWQWGDIFNTYEITWYIDNNIEYGVIKEVENEEEELG